MSDIPFKDVIDKALRWGKIIATGSSVRNGSGSRGKSIRYGQYVMRFDIYYRNYAVVSSELLILYRGEAVARFVSDVDMRAAQMLYDDGVLVRVRRTL